jgi:hypothetical protein
VSFSKSDSELIRSPSSCPAWFAREEARAADLARRFHIERDVSSWDRRRARCAAVEMRLAADALRAAADEMVVVEREREREQRRERELAGRRPRFTLCGQSYESVIRQQRRRNEGEAERQAKRVRWLRREEELAGEEMRERLRVSTLEARALDGQFDAIPLAGRNVEICG